MRKIVVLIFALLFSSPLWAGSSTVNYTSTGGSPFRTTTDGSSNNLSQTTIWDSAAGANGASVDANHQLGVASPNTGEFVDGWNATEGTKADTAWVSGSGSIVAIAKTIANNTGNAIPAGSNAIGTVTIAAGSSGTAGFPTGATPITASATGTTAATTATLPGTTGKTTYVCALSIRANATAAATGNATVTGVITGTMNYTQWTAPNASGVGVVEQIFSPCVPASAANTAIAVVSAAPGTGGVVSVSAAGFQL